MEDIIKDNLVEEKRCIKCEVLQKIDKFTPLKFNNMKLVRDEICDKCKRKNKIKNIITDLNINENINILYMYRMNDDEYNYLFEKQKGCCKICNRHQSTLKRKLSVDHNHTTDEVRGLLCGNCNSGLGMYKDNIQYLLNAIVYLDETSSGIPRRKQKAI